MPVVEHSVHPRTRQAADFRYGCHGKPRERDGYWAPDREYLTDGSFVRTVRPITDVMSAECRYDMSLTDAGCTDCPHRGSGEAYAEWVREQGK